ncbi:hypothetical protein Q7P35_008977 [Cladosporium inversicolor]
MANSYKDVKIFDNARVHMGNRHEYRYELEDPLRHLPFASNALFNASYREHDSDCLAGTRVDIIQKICQWVDGEDKSSIFWLSGWPGTGKSAIARTIARKFNEQGRLAASFFFSRGGGDSSHAGLFVTSIARQLAECSVLDVRRYILESLGDSQVVAQSLQDQWARLVLRPLSRCEKGGTSGVFVCVVDALDECEDQRSIGTLLQLLPRLGELVDIRIRILVTSRPETPIRHGFQRMEKGAHHGFVLHKISPEVTNRDIQVFLEHRLSNIAFECCLSSDWPGRQILALMVQHAQGLFIWAETACRYIGEEALLAEGRLNVLMDRGSGVVAGPERHLDQIYNAILAASVLKNCSEHEQEMVYSHLRLILGTIIVLFSTLSAKALGELLAFPTLKISQTVAKLHSVLDIPDDPAQPMRLHHDSFRNFLVDEKRCEDQRLLVTAREAHGRLATGCIKVMVSTLKEDVCGQGWPGVTLSDVGGDLMNECLPGQTQYACLYWVSHVVQSGQQLIDNDEVHNFLQEHILYWIEAMGWMSKISEAIKALASLEVISKDERCAATLHALAHDAKRFIMHARSGIQQAPLQTYVLASLFAPSKSIVRQLSVCTTLVDCVKRSPRMLEHWSAILMTLEGHSDRVTAVQFSRDGSKLVSVSDDGKVIVWDPNTGAQLQTLEGHSSGVTAVQFSCDGSKLASASDDGKVIVWDPNTGAKLQTLEGHSREVAAVQFSRDGSKLASASHDGKVIVWDPNIGAQLQTLEGHSDWVTAVQFSRDGSKLASASHDGKVIVWDPNIGAQLQTLEGHSDWVTAMQFSRDSSKLASASHDGKVIVWDPNTGAQLQTLEGHSDWVTAVQFSRDGSKLVSVSDDGKVIVWDPNTGAKLQTLEGHSDRVTAAQFSRDGSKLASASDDGKVIVWDPNIGAKLQTLEGHSREVAAVQFSRDGSKLASASYDGKVIVWDPNTGAQLQTLEGHSDWVTAVQFSRDGSKLASASHDGKVIVWDPNTGAQLQTLEGHSDWVTAVQFSRDGSKLASASDDEKVIVWDPNTGAKLQTLGTGVFVSDMAFSANGSFLRTNVGRFDLQTEPSSPSGGDAWSPHLQVRGSLWHDHKTIWSPPEYLLSRRADAAHERIVASSRSSGAIYTVDDDNEHSPDEKIDSMDPSIRHSMSMLSYEDISTSNLSVEGEWISWHDRKMIWLPPEHRSYRSAAAVRGSVMTFGHSNGNVSFWEISG